MKTPVTNSLMPERAIQFPWSDQEFDARVTDAVREYWSARQDQSGKQKDLGRTDTGTRGEVTGGQHLTAFTKLLCEVAHAANFTQEEVRFKVGIELPGYFRPMKKWDSVIIRGNRLCAAIEIKSQVGPSFGNNFNNRSEEAIGSSTDFWIAYREGVIGAQSPWLGYFLMVEEAAKSTSRVKLPSAVFEPMPIFNGTSYIDRYGILCRRLVLERNYSAAAFLTSPKDSVTYAEPSAELTMKAFAKGLFGHLIGIV